MFPSVASSVACAASRAVTPTSPACARRVDVDLGVVGLSATRTSRIAADGARDLGDGVGLGFERVEVLVLDLDHDGAT